MYFCLLGASHTLEVRARPVPARRGEEGGLTRCSRATQMGCGGSKPEEAGGAVAKPEEVDHTALWLKQEANELERQSLKPVAHP